MKPKYSKRTVDEAVQLLDVYASRDRCFADRPSWTMLGLARSLVRAAEAAQRLREGWRP
jgi:hypothetical protein